MKSDFNVSRFGEIFPHMENILQFGAYTVNFKTNATEWSDGVYSILGLSHRELDYTPGLFYTFIDPEDLDRVKVVIDHSIATKTPYEIDFGITDTQGRKKHILAKNYLKMDDAGNLLEYTGIIKDITERYLYNKQRENKIELLNKSNNSLQEFVYIASHDLQEPLRKISTFIERFRSKYSDTLEDEGKVYLDKIQKSSNNMQVLIDDLLRFSRLSTEDGTPEKFRLQDIIDSVVQDLEVKMEESKAIVECDNMPEVEGCSTQMRQLFSNLINNAIKFRREDVAPVIKINCGKARPADYPNVLLAPDKKYIKITVADNGIGFEKEYAEHIFKIFQRLHSKSEYSGSGIGLAICQKIVENHKGFIFAASTPGKGSTFTILLPESKQ